MSASGIPAPETLLAFSYHRERVLARRRSAREQMPLAVALRQVLEHAAGSTTLIELIALRAREQDMSAARQLLRLEEKRLRLVARETARAPNPLAWHGWFDGSAMPNPGSIGLGAVLRAPDGKLVSICRAAGFGDSTAAEYLALIALLEAALASEVQHLVVHGDSHVVIADLRDQVPVKSAPLQVHRQRAQWLLRQFETIELVWIPRARNGAADVLARQAQTLRHE